MAQTLERNQTKSSGQSVTQAGDVGALAPLWQQAQQKGPLSEQELHALMARYESVATDLGRLDERDQFVCRLIGERIGGSWSGGGFGSQGNTGGSNAGNT